jgi:predicted porin
MLYSGTMSKLYRHTRGVKSAPVLFTVTIIIALFVISPFSCFAGHAQDSNKISEDELVPFEKVEVLTTNSQDKAETFAKTLEGSGYKSTVVKEGIGDKQVYKVFILINEAEEDIRNLSGELSQDPAGMKPVQENERRYESDKKPSWDILGRQERYVHASLALSGIYTNNVENSRDNKKSDFSTVLSPAIWLVVPHTRRDVAPAELSVRSPGGSLLSSQWPDSLLHYQASLYYRTDIPLTSSSGNLRYGTTPAHTLSGNLFIKGNRLSLLAEDHYEFSYHEQEAGVINKTGEHSRYNSNYFGVTLSYETRRRLVLSGGYSNFITWYQSDVSDLRNRQDDGFFASMSYKLSSRVSVLAEYKYFGISYDHHSVLDSKEHYFLGGISWAITAKSKGLFKAGYGIKDFAHSRSYKNLSLELQLDHRLTPKTLLLAGAYRKTSESNLLDMAFSLTNGVDVRLQHLLTPKLTASAGFLYLNDHYKHLEGRSEDAESNTYQWSIALQYAFKRWLRGNIGYAYTRKSASLSELEYTSDTLFFSVMTSI